MTTKSKTNQKHKPELQPTELKLLHLARCPVGLGVTLGHLRSHTRRLEESVLRDIEKLLAAGHLEVCTKEKTPSFFVSELGRKEAGLLYGQDLELVRLVAEETVMRVDQIARLVGRPRAKVKAEIKRLIKRGLLESRVILSGELPAVWATVEGLEEAGYGRLQYRPLPTLHLWPKVFTLVNVRELVVAEFEDGEWECARTRSLNHDRDEGPIAAGVMNLGGKKSLAVEVQLNTNSLRVVCGEVEKLSKEHTKVRYYCDEEGRAVVEKAIKELGVRNVKVLDVPGELIYPSQVTRIRFSKERQAA